MFPSPQWVHLCVDCVLRIAKTALCGFNCEGVNGLPCTPKSPPSHQIEGELSGIEESVKATPTPLKQGCLFRARRKLPWPLMPRRKYTCPKVLIGGEWRKVPDSYPKDASGQLEGDRQIINELA